MEAADYGRILRDLDRFYETLDVIRRQTNGHRFLASCTGSMDWPARGVSFFCEHGESRDSGQGLRVVWVGTHAVSTGSNTTFWGRLRTHRGALGGAGNHRGSIFRLRVGTALLARGDYPEQIRVSWGKGSSAPKAVRCNEYALECKVSEYIGGMPFLWLAVEDEPGSTSKRKYIQRNALALLGAASRLHMDSPSENWLGHSCSHPTVRGLGLWNVDHVFEEYDSGFVDLLRTMSIGVEK